MSHSNSFIDYSFNDNSLQLKLYKHNKYAELISIIMKFPRIVYNIYANVYLLYDNLIFINV